MPSYFWSQGDNQRTGCSLTCPVTETFIVHRKNNNINLLDAKNRRIR